MPILAAVGGGLVTNALHPERLAAADRAPPLMRTSASQEFSCVMKSHGDERQRRAGHSSAVQRRSRPACGCGRWNMLIRRVHANKGGFHITDRAFRHWTRSCGGPADGLLRFCVYLLLDCHLLDGCSSGIVAFLIGSAVLLLSES